MVNKEAYVRYSTAKEYVETIKLVLTSPHYKDKHIVIALRPTQLLAGFAVELYLKAWLLADGVESSEVQAFRHNLAAAFSCVKERGFPVSHNVELLVDRVAGPHGNHVYRYTREDAEIEVLNWNYVLAILDELDVMVDTHVGASASRGNQPKHAFFPTQGIKLATDPDVVNLLNDA